MQFTESMNYIQPEQLDLRIIFSQCDQAPIKVLSKHLDNSNIFDLVIQLLEKTNLNQHVIKLVEDENPYMTQSTIESQ